MKKFFNVTNYTQSQIDVTKPKRNLKTCAKFCYLGIIAALTWNVILNVLISLRDVTFKLPNGDKLIKTAVVTCSFNVIVFFTSFFISRLKPNYNRTIKFGFISTSLGLLAFLILSTILTVKMPVMIIICCTAVLCGLFSGTAFSSLFITAAHIEPFERGVMDSAQIGAGLCGCLTFSIWLLLTRIIYQQFDPNKSILYCIITVICLVFLMGLYGIYLVFYAANLAAKYDRIRAEPPIQKKITNESDKSFIPITQTPWNNQDLQWSTEFDSARKKPNSVGEKSLVRLVSSDSFMLVQNEFFQQPNFTDKEEDSTSKTQNWTELQTLKVIAIPLLSVSFTTFSTYFLFPNVTPYQWLDITTTDKDVRVGIFQVGNFIGRSLPFLFPILSSTPRWFINIFVISRVVFFPLFYSVTMTPPFQCVYMAVLSLSFGIILALETLNVITLSKEGGITAQSSAASYTVTMFLGGASLGVILAVPLS